MRKVYSFLVGAMVFAAASAGAAAVDEARSPFVRTGATAGTFGSSASSIVHKNVLEPAAKDALQYYETRGEYGKTVELQEAIDFINDLLRREGYQAVDDLVAVEMLLLMLMEASTVQQAEGV